MARYRVLAFLVCLWVTAEGNSSKCEGLADCDAEEDASVLLQSMVKVAEQESVQKETSTDEGTADSVDVVVEDGDDQHDLDVSDTESLAGQGDDTELSTTDAAQLEQDEYSEEEGEEHIDDENEDQSEDSHDNEDDHEDELEDESVDEQDDEDDAVHQDKEQDVDSEASEQASSDEEATENQDVALVEGAEDGDIEGQELENIQNTETDSQEVAEDAARRHRRRRWRRRRSSRRRRARRARRSSRRRRARRARRSRRTRRSSARRRRTRRARRTSSRRRSRSFFRRRRTRRASRRRASIFARRRRTSRASRRRASIFARRRRTSAVNNGKINSGCAWVNCAAVQKHAKSPKYFMWTRGFAVLAGNGKSTCCTAEKGLDDRKQYLMMSASKMVAAYTILSLVGAKKLSLETPVSSILTDFWTKSAGDKRSQVKVKHLLDQTDGFPHFSGGMGNCRRSTTHECAKEAYERGVRSTPGSTYEYSETSFYILGAVAIKASGMKTSNFNDVFKTYLGNRLGMKCDYRPYTWDQKKFPNKIDPGAHLWCSAYEYAKFLRAVTAKKVPGIPSHLVDLAEKPHTQRVKMTLGGQPVGPRIEYGYGLWRHCQTERCDSRREVTLVHSMGMYGFIPVIYRKGSQSMWMIVARSAPPIGIPDSMKLVTDFTKLIVPFKLSGTAPMQQNGLMSRHPMKFNR